jgi:hypothetical protein
MPILDMTLSRPLPMALMKRFLAFLRLDQGRGHVGQVSKASQGQTASAP